MTDFFIHPLTSWAGAVSGLYSQAMSLSHKPPGSALLLAWPTPDADPGPPICVDSEPSLALFSEFIGQLGSLCPGSGTCLGHRPGTQGGHTAWPLSCQTE